MTFGRRHMARRNAIQALYQRDITGQSVQEIEDNFVGVDELDDVDKEYFHCLIHEVERHHEQIDVVLAECLDRDLVSVGPVERAILRLGTYELQYRLEIPTRVVLNEAVRMSHIFGAEEAYRFVNGVLDGLAKRFGRDTG